MIHVALPTYALILIGICLGALLTLAICLAHAEFAYRRRRKLQVDQSATTRRYELALRDILGACDRHDDLRHVRRIARRGLHPTSVQFDDQPIMPEVSHG